MDIVNQFKLPKYIKGKSFSEASQMLQDKIRDKETLEEMMGRLRDAQEYSKQMQEAQEAQANPEMAQQQMGEQMPPEMMQGQGGQPQMDPAMMEQMMAQQQGGQQQMAMGGMLNMGPGEPIENEIMTATGKGDQTALKKASAKLNMKPIDNTPTRQALYNKVQANNGSFDPKLSYINRDIGHTFKPLEKHTLMQAKIDRMNDPTKSKPMQLKLDRDAAIYKQQMGRKAYVADNMMNNVSTEEAERRAAMGNEFKMGGYSKSNDYFLGGLFGGDKAQDAAGMAGNASEGAAAGGAGGPGPGGYMKAANTAMDFGMEAFGKTKEEDMNNISAMESQGGATVGGAMKGAQAGMAFGPWGAAVGGVLGGAAGLIGSGKRNSERVQAEGRKTGSNFRKANEMYAKGGYMKPSTNKYADGDYLDLSFLNTPAQNIANAATGVTPIMADNNQAAIAPNSMYGKDPSGDFMKQSTMYKGNLYDNGTLNSDYTVGDADLNGFNDAEEAKFGDKKPNTSKSKQSKSDRNEKISNAAIAAGRLAPAAMNLFQLNKMKSPEVEKYDRLDQVYKPQFQDERRMLNAIDEGFNPDLLTEGAGGSLGRFASGATAMNLAKMKAKSAGASAASKQKADELTKKQAFDKDTAMRNAATQRAETVANAQNRGAAATNKSKFLSQIGTDVGNISKEALFKKQAKEMYGYSFDGKYFVNSDGDKKTVEEMAKMNKSNGSMFGGYLNKKKK